MRSGNSKYHRINSSLKMANIQKFKEAVLLFAVVALIGFDSTSGCLDFGSGITVIINSTRTINGTLTVGIGFSLSDNLDLLVVRINDIDGLYHCKQENEDVPPTPAVNRRALAVATAAKYVKGMNLPRQLLKSLGLTNKAMAQSCTLSGERLCIYLQTADGGQWYCSDQADVSGLEVLVCGQSILKCQ